MVKEDEPGARIFILFRTEDLSFNCVSAISALHRGRLAIHEVLEVEPQAAVDLRGSSHGT